MASHHTSLINGSFDQTISAIDRGFSYGDGVFRTMKIKDGQPVSWPFHYQKLVADCAVIGIVCPSAELLMSDIQQLFPIDQFDQGQVYVAKIIITRGEGERGYAPPAVTIPTRVLIKSAMPTYAESHYSNGVRLRLCDTRLALQPKLAGIKHLNRLENVLARTEWRDESIFDGVMLDTNDHVIECTMSNIFIRVDHHLYTPDLKQCGVAGITRHAIMGLGNLLGLICSETKLTVTDLLNADEVLICNSLYGAFQVTALEDKTWNSQPLASKIRNILTHG